MTADKREEFERAIQVFCEGIRALEDQPANRDIPFECPLCGNTAFAYRYGYNGHRHVHCPTCNIQAAE